MKNPPDAINEYIESLDDTTRRQIMLDYDYYEEQGSIGASVLRTNAKLFMKKQGISTNIILCMELIASSTFRYYAKKYWQD